MAALMVVNLLPMSVLAEELAEVTAPILETETISKTEKTLNEGECPHSNVETFTVNACICAGCSAKKGTGDLILCKDCGKKAWENSWGEGATYSPDEVTFDLENQTVTLRCDACKAEKKYSLTTGDEITDEPGEQPHNHTWDEGVVIAPTCTQQGYKEYTCTVCGAVSKDDLKPALGHQWGEWTVVTSATCTTPGTEERVCNRICDGLLCGKTDTKELNTDADKHKGVETERQVPTCTEAGYVRYKCELCKKEYNVDAPATGHNWNELDRTEPTCKDNGQVVKRCTICGATETDILAATGKHDWAVLKNTATCTDEGYIIEECTVCQTQRTTDSPALGHQWDEEGWSEDNWTVVTEATCTTPGTEMRVCNRICDGLLCGKTETREVEALGHDYDPATYRCKNCGETYPEVQAILDAIDNLPDPDTIDQNNALAVFNEVTDIIQRYEEIDGGPDSEVKDALEKYFDSDKVSKVHDACDKYIIFTTYEEKVGEQTFGVYWNDNNMETDKRTPAEDFLNDSEAVLRYEIVSEDGKTVVASGVLTNAADANKAFAFLNINLPENEQLLYISGGINSEEYEIETNVDLPVGYTATYTDYSTGEAYTSEFKVNYTLTLKNPAPESYITTKPERTSGAVTLKDGEEVIFTKLLDWSAHIVWYDDDNRSAKGGSSTEHTPRLSAGALKAATQVYCYPQGYNVQDGDPVTGDFGYVIDGDEIKLTGLPAYDNEGNPLAYYIHQDPIMAANADYVSGNRYKPTFQNVNNFSAKVNGVYDGGYLIETLYNVVPFYVNKNWADGRTPDQRPNCVFYIWRITEDYNGDMLAIDPEFSYAIPDCAVSYDVPKEDTNEYRFVRSMGEENLYLFPMYDTEGRRYIYFGKESGLPGEYSSILDNSGAKVPQSVIDEFSQGTNTAYFLNGATITNTVGARTPMPVSKDFKALSLQNRLDANTPITATFLLQKKGADGNWVPANVETDGIVYNPADGVETVTGRDNSLSVTLTKFAAEDMSASYGGVTVSRYDSDYQRQEFRWVETGVSVNGVSADYNPSEWESDDNGGMRYTGDIIVYDGQTSTVLGNSDTQTSGPDDTTAIFNAVASGSHFTNQLVGKHQVEIRKYFVDENGNNIAADPVKMAGQSVTFTIYRDDVAFDEVTLTIDDLSKGNDYWVKLLNYDRYDEEGREYHFKVKETAFNDQWTNRTEDYEVSVIEYPAGSRILVKRLLTVYVNGPGPGDTLEFDVEKKWLDDSDLQTRNPVVAAVYRFRGADGKLLDKPVQVSDDVTLFLNNNWYKKIVIPAIDSADHKDSTENYVILEKGILVDGTLVPTNYDFDFTSQALADIHAAIVSGTAYAGITGSTEREDGSWDGLCYRYKLFERAGYRAETPAMASYVLTNLRIGKQDYIVEKTWKAGGEIRKCTFSLYDDKNTELAQFTLDVENGMAKLDEPVKWNAGYAHSNIGIKATDAGKDTNGNYKASVEIRGLEKFDEVGAQKEYSIREIAIFDKNGISHEVVNGKCQAGDETYAVSVSTGVERADNDNHRSPDLYTVAVTNTLTNEYDLVSNKVWRDANQVVRPDVCFSVYRKSTQDDGLYKLVNSDKVDTAALSKYLAVHPGERVITDRYWDTHINSYWWTCTVEGMQQYDADGYPYVYYAVEKISNTHVGEACADSMSTSALYVGYYCNYTADQRGYRPKEEGTTTQEVFGVENDKLCSIKDNVFILADGIHKASNGEYKDYYSATAVNRPERERTVSGRKLWKLPHGWTVAEGELPTVEIELYRTTEEISFSDVQYKGKPEAYAKAIKDKAESEGGLLSTAEASSKDHYEYSFVTYVPEGKEKETPLPRYDEWGSTYYYYTLETPEWVGDDTEKNRQNFPESAVVYEDNDFYINNVFSSEPPYVEVTVEKTWTLSDEVWAKLQKYGLEGIELTDLAPATISLYGVPTNAEHSEITNAHFDFGSVTLDPSSVTDIDSNTQTLTARYTFKEFYNDETKHTENLPYYWLHNYVIDYYLKETHTNGYDEVYDTDTKVVFDGEKTTLSGRIYYNSGDNVFQLTNIYTGIENRPTDFTFNKVWNDKYVGNDEYRPNSVTFTIGRRVGDEVDSDFAETVTLNKSQFSGEDTWSYTLTDLLKYAPSGKLYVYFVKSEEITLADGTKQIATSTESGENELGNYVLTSKSNDRLINTLSDQLSTTVEASKNWTVNGVTVSSYTNSSNTGFNDLRKMGVFPDSVQFAVQRAIPGGTYNYVPASAYQDSVHKVTVNGQSVVGHQVNLTTANESNYALMLHPSMKWENLPKRDTNGNEYTYRVIEILHWSDGTSSTVTSSGDLTDRGMTASIEPGTEANVFRLTNDLQADKVRIAKIWDDGNGNENTRPSEITVTVKPVGNASGKTFTLTTSGHATTQDDANVYYSEYFYIPKEVAKTYGVTGAKYEITESYTKRNGAEYTQTVTSDDGNVVVMADGTYALQLTNTYQNPGRKTLDLEATKEWSGDTDWQDVTRPEISFKVQYKDRADGKWKDITDGTMSQFSKTAQSAVQTVPAGNEVTWTKMYKYWADVTTDGVAEFIHYRVVEVVDNTTHNSSYDWTAQEFKDNGKTLSDGTEKATATLTNTLQTKEVKISKSWIKNGDASDKLTNDEVKKLVALNAIPNELTFVIEYRLTGSSAWTTIPNGTVAYTAEQLLQTQDTGKKLPRYDKDGNEISYRVRETKVKYLNGNESYYVTWTGDTGEIGSISTTPQSITYAAPTAAMVNNYQYVSLAIGKGWLDESNRDGLRDDISVTLYRDGDPYSVVNTATRDASQTNSFCKVTKDGDNWTLSWNYLPKYQKDKAPAAVNESVYTWKETSSVTGYEDPIYKSDPAGKETVENTYQPMRGTVVAIKTWADGNNRFNSRPDEIYLKLQYKVGSGSWTDVTHKDLTTVNGKDLYQDDAHAAYTTSEDGWRTVKKADNWNEISWADLPVKALSGSTSTTVTYRVIEGVKTADGSIKAIANDGKLNGYTVAYTDVSLEKNGDSKTSIVTNELDITTLQVKKNWTDDNTYASKVRPESVTFNVEWKKGDSAWSAIPEGVSNALTYVGGKSTVTVTKDGNWDKTITNLPKADANGVAYEYRVIETKIHYADGDVAVNGTMVGPYNITAVTVDAEKYNGKYTAEAENKLLTGELTVTKTWADGDDRDGGRREITVKLYRDGVEFDECTLNAGNDWTHTWTLPVRINKAANSTDYAKYTVKEVGEDGNAYTGNNGIAYTVRYGGETTVEINRDTDIENRHTPLLLNLTATKSWGNDQDKINVRPDSVQFKLQYHVSGTTAWNDFPAENVLGAQDASVLTEKDSEQVYMVSDDTVTQTLSESNDWTAAWHNLTANVRIDGETKQVEYRAVELTDAISNYTPANGGVSSAVTYDSQSKSVTISNELMRGSIKVSKVFTVNGQTADGDTLYRLVKTLKLLPEELTVTLSYQDGSETKRETKTISFNESTKSYTTCTFDNLPVADANGNEINYTVTDSAEGYKFVECGTTENVTVSKNTTTQADVTNNYVAGSLTVTKNWVDENNRDDGRQPITAQLYRDGVKVDEQVLNESNGWSYTWQNLPVYQNGTDAKSVYTVKEKTEQNGTYTGKNNIAYTVKYSDGVTLEQAADATTGGYTASAAITNTHETFTGSLTVGKVWRDEDNKFGSRPANIELTLQYKAADGSWVAVGDDDVYTTSTNPGTISNTTASYTWEGLPVNLNGRSVTYRVVETSVSGYKTAVYSVDEVSLTKAEDTYTAGITVTNELDTTSLTINKEWEYVTYLTPTTANFKVQYMHGNSDWQDYEGKATVTYSAAANGGQTVISGLPKTDGEGNAYAYRVKETTTTYSSGSMHTTASDEGSFDENGGWSGNPGVYTATVRGYANDDGSFTFNANNEVIKGSLSITKIWDDDNDRDGGRRSVTVELYRDGDKFDEKTLSADGSWTATFTNLPVYQNTSSSEMPAKSVYTVKEKGLNEAGQYVGSNDRLYEVSYADGVSLQADADNIYSAEASLTNTHEPLSFSVKAMKAWEDTKDYGIRPDVQLELCWATSTDAADWTTVEQSATAPKGGDGKTVTTTSPVRQTLKNEDQTIGETWGSAQWKDLPAYVIVDGASVPVYYKAFEVGEIPEAYESAESVAVSYANAQGDDMIATVQVVNTLTGKMSVTVQKTWLDQDEQYNDHAGSITVQLQYVTSDTDTAWKNIAVDGKQVLSADSTIPWSYTWENLRNDYTYRVIELDMTFGSVKLETLPTGGTAGEIGGYTYTAEATVNADGTMTQCDITNKLIVGKIEVTKTWQDSHDRDGMRPDTLTFDLYRDNGTEPIATKTVNVTADGIEECVFENIPVYREGTRELSHYYVVETDEDGYTAAYEVEADSTVSLSDAVTDVTAVTDQTTPVTNRHETILFRVEATKTWDDANDPYGLRPTEVSVKLQYAFDPDSEEWADVTVVTAVPDPAEEDGKLVFTTSELIQSLTREDLLEEDGDIWGTAAWENLPAYALMPAADGEYVSAPVYYRVVEVESVAESYGSEASDPMCYDDAEGDDMTAAGTVTNPLEDRTKLTVTKKWIGGKMKVQIIAQLQYRVDAESEWAPVPKNAEALLSADNDWTYTFTDLRADYEYRCVEAGLILASGKTIDVRVTRDKGDAVYGYLLGYSSISETKTDEQEDSCYVSKLTNRYIPDEPGKGPKTGDTFNGLLYSAGALSSALGITMLSLKRKKRENGKRVA